MEATRGAGHWPPSCRARSERLQSRPHGPLPDVRLPASFRIPALSSSRTKRAPGLVPAMLLAFALAFAVYAPLSAPTVMFGDSAEFQVVGLTGGIPHATGYPTYVLVGRAFAHLPFADRAYRITFVSVCFGAATIALLVLVLHELGIALVPALIGALLFGSTFTFWRVALRAEVYTLSTFIALLALWRTIVALRSPRLGDAALAAFLLGLTLTGHLSFVLPVAVLGLALAWHVSRARPPAVGALAALLGAFLLGLTPYLYIAWADGQHFPYDYLRLVASNANPRSGPLPGFDTPWERVVWLVTGRNHLPVEPMRLLRLGLLRDVARAGALQFLFELGPVAALLALVGFVRQLARDAGMALLLALAGLASFAFTAATSTGPMVHIFMLPAAIVCVVFVAAGLERVVAGLAQTKGPWLIVAPALAFVLVALPPHLLRVWANDHPIGRGGLHAQEEDPNFRPVVLPSMRGYVEPRVYGVQVLAAIPRDALVLAPWPEYATLEYFRIVERRRPDLTLQLQVRQSLAERMVLWQERHRVSRRPFVFLGPPPRFAPVFAGLDSLRLPSGRKIWVRRAPIDR